MRTLHRFTCTCVGLSVVAVAACAKKNANGAGDTTTMTMASGATTSAMRGTSTGAAPGASSTAPSGGTISLADVAGKWNERATPDSGRDTTPTMSVITATNSTSGWTLTFPGRAAMPLRVSTSGDSIITDAGPYPSVRRKGTQVTIHGVMRMQNGMLVGTTVAHYKVKTADSVMTLRTQATRAK